MYKMIFSLILLSAAYAPSPFNTTKYLAIAKNAQQFARAAAQRTTTLCTHQTTVHPNDMRQTDESTPKMRDDIRYNALTNTYWEDDGTADGRFFKIFKFDSDKE